MTVTELLVVELIVGAFTLLEAVITVDDMVFEPITGP